MFRRSTLILFAIWLAACAGLQMTAEAPSAEVSAYEKEWRGELAQVDSIMESLETLEGPWTVSTVLEPLNEISILLYDMGSKAYLYFSVHPDADIRASADEAYQAYSDIVTNLTLSRPIYEAVEAVDTTGLDVVTKRLVEETLLDFRRSGVDQDETTRERIRVLREELTRIEQEFDRNITEAVGTIQLDSIEELDGLPQDYIDAHPPGEDGKIAITTSYPDLLPFLSYAHSDTRRRELYRSDRRRGYPENVEVLQQMISLRHELANLVGYDTWASYVTEDKMIETAEAAQTFIDDVTVLIRPAVQREQGIFVERLQQINPGASAIGTWQSYYLLETLKRERFDYDSQELRQYFTYEKVRDGLFNVVSTMYGVTIRPVEAEVWHPSVESYEMWDGDQLIGRFHLDMHPRENKYQHGASFQYKAGVPGRQTPEQVLVCNFPGGDGSPVLMIHDDVVTFFHEFGHLLHDIFGGHQRWVDFNGTSTEWDFVEAPAMMFEEWAWDSEVLKSFATNAAGESIPNDLLERMHASRDFGEALAVQRQLAYAAISLWIHNRNPEGIDLDDLSDEAEDRYSPYQRIEDTYFIANFGHLTDYSAIYYTYMWSLAIAKDLLSAFDESGSLLNPEVALRYRQTILEPGGSKPAVELLRDFLGRDYSFDAFAAWLTGE